MSINMELYNRCHRCKNLQKSLYMEMEIGENLYNYWCEHNSSMGEIECNKFEDKDVKVDE